MTTLASISKDALVAVAEAQGFSLCRIARAGRAPHAEHFLQWLDDGFHGPMEWMVRTAPQRSDPTLLLPNLRSIIVLATNYLTEDPPPPPDSAARGRICRYARASDYHDIIKPRMETVAQLLADAGGEQRCFIDGGPVLERDWAAASGLVWHGKSTMGINPTLGTWFFLSVILTTLEFVPDSPIRDRCGACTRCIDACPTGAIISPVKVDARRCISFLTIENKSSIPEEFREAIGDRIFGCDACLDACPWNRFAKASHDASFQARTEVNQRPLRSFLDLDTAAFKALFRGSPILRSKRKGFLRNVCVALGNVGTHDDLPALHKALLDEEPLVQEHAAWAISKIESRTLPRD